MDLTLVGIVLSRRDTHETFAESNQVTQTWASPHCLFRLAATNLAANISTDTRQCQYRNIKVHAVCMFIDALHIGEAP